MVSDETLFSSSIFRVGNIITKDLHLQLIRWIKAEKIIQLRRGLYVLAEPYRKITPHSFLIANHLKKASYVSLQSALAHHAIIPEYVPVVTSVTTRRPEQIKTKLGSFTFNHIKKAFFNGYQEMEVIPGQFAFVATPEKALLDLIYLTPKAETKDYLHELRLQNLDKLNLSALMEFAEESKSPKILRASRRIMHMASEEGYKEL